VPHEPDLGPCRYGKIGAFYFYHAGSDDDAAFGFFDIELSVQAIAPEQARIELYCTADGYQSSRGIGTAHPMRIVLMAGDQTLASVDWTFADVICGHADPMSFSIDIAFDHADRRRVDRVALWDVRGLAAPCEQLS
jgi:hypothetical protein